MCPPPREEETATPSFAATFDDGVVRLSGELDVRTAARGWPDARALVDRALNAAPDQPIQIDVRELAAIDGAGAALIARMSADLVERTDGAGGQVRGAAGQVAALLELYTREDSVPPPGGDELHESLLAQIGRRSIGATADAVGGLTFVGSFVRAVAEVLVRPTRFPFRDWVTQLSRTGPDGVAIVALVNFLVGTILAFQSAVQLERYGAELFVANLVGLSVVRELGPLMTAILLAGRSGAAFAAELGTMRVSEEVDALRSLGLSPQRFLVLPRVAALAITAPLLTIIANAMGILGGVAIGCGVMGLTFNAYWQQTAASIASVDVITGLVKAVGFGAIVGLISCHRGLTAGGGAEGVGRSTTSAVVTVLFALIVADAVFTYLFTLYGL